MMSIFSYSQIDVIATAGTLNGSYANIKLAFDAINAGTHQGIITINVVSTGTDAAAPAVLNSGDAAPASYTSVLIRPTNDGVIISATTVGGRGVIELNGADNVTIDGDNPNTGGTNRNLEVKNLATATTTYTSVIRLSTAAAVTSTDNNIIKNCKITGSAVGRNISTATSTTGSENTTFGIYAGGNGGAAITSVTTNTALATTTINNLLVDNNEIISCARAIVFNGATAVVSPLGTTISNNLIGDQVNNLTGVPPYSSPNNTVYTKAIWVQGTTSITVQGNTVKNILSYIATTLSGVELAGAIGASGGSINVNNNNINTIANNSTSSGASTAILVTSSTLPFNVNSNVIKNIQTIGTASVIGISIASTATSGLIEKNKIDYLHANNIGAYAARGIVINSGTAIVLQNNFIWNLNAANDNSTTSTTFAVKGISISGGTNHKIYNNSVKLFGAMLGSNTFADNTTCFMIAGTGQTGIDVRNNIFSNTMTGASATVHACVQLPSGGTSAMNLTMNNNAYYKSSNSNSYYGITQSTFNSYSTLGALAAYTSTLSVSADNDNVSYASENAAPYISDTDLHLNLSSGEITNMEQKGFLNGITSDIDGDLRPNSGTTFPDLGADEVILAVCTGQPNAGVASPSTVIKCSGQTQTFTATGLSSGTGISYQWKVSNTSGSGYNNVMGGSGANTSSYTTGSLISGTYYYILETTCSSSGQSNISNELTLTVNPTPTATASSNSPVCGGATLNLTGSTDIGATFSWSGPNSYSSTMQNPSITNVPNNASGSYSFIATLNGCNSTPSSAIVAIVGAPVVSMSATPDVICAGENSQLLANVSNFLNLKITEVTLYDQGTGLTTPYPAFIPSTGVQDFVEVSNVSADPLDVSGIKLFDYPSNSSTSNHTFTFPNGTIIPGNGVSVIHLGSGTDSPADLYFNTGGTGNILSSGGLIGIVLKDGTNIIDAVGVNSGYVFNAATGVTASDWSGFASSPSTFAGSIRTAASDNNNGSDWVQANSPSPLQTIGTYNGGFTSIPSNVTYLWSPSTYLTSTNIENPIAQNVLSSIEYHVTVTNDANCVTLDTVNVTVSGGAVINNNPISISRCVGQSASFNVVAVGPSLTYQWKKNGIDLMDVGNVTGSMTPTLNISGVTAPDGDNYTVQISSSCGSPVLSNPATLTVNPNPVVSMTPTGNQTICAPNSVLLTASPSNESYIWKRNNILISGANNNTYSANLAGIYKAIVTITATGCKDSTSVLDTIFVNPQPASPLASATPSDICTGQDINLMSSAFVSGYTMNPSGTEAFIDIEATGTSIASVSDDSEHNITMQPFTFNGVSYNSARLGMNGAIVLGVTSGEITHINAALPSTAIVAGNIFLAPWWDDLDVRSAAPLTTIHLDTVGSKYIIQYTNVAHNDDLTFNVKFQIQLDNATNQIHFIYPDAEMGGVAYDYGVSGTIGIQYSATEALQYSTNTASLSNGQCITFTPNTLGYAWTGPNSFSSSMQNPTITSATSLANGQYQVVFTNLVSGCTDTAFTTINVTGDMVMNGNNNGAQSLRKAIECANATDTIYFDAGVTTVTLSDSILLNKNLLIIDNNAPGVNLDFNLSSLNFGLKVPAANDVQLENINVREVGNNGASVKPLILNQGDLILKNASALKVTTNPGEDSPLVKSETGSTLGAEGSVGVKKN